MSARRSLAREGIIYKVVLNHWLPRRLGHDAFTFAHRIYVAGGALPADLHAHEFEHLRQQRELGLIRFTLRYLWQARHGYAGISFEKEAYAIQARPEIVGTFDEVRA